jgi:hypothetical protein
METSLPSLLGFLLSVEHVKDLCEVGRGEEPIPTTTKKHGLL